MEGARLARPSPSKGGRRMGGETPPLSIEGRYPSASSRACSASSFCIASAGGAFRGFAVERLGLRELRLAEQKHEAVGLLDAGDGGIGQELAGEREVLDRLLLARAVGQLGEHAADLADDLGVIGAEREMGLGVVGRERERLVEARLRPCRRVPSASALTIEISCA